MFRFVSFRYYMAGDTRTRDFLRGSSKKYFLDTHPDFFKLASRTSPHLDHLRKNLMVAKIVPDGREIYTY